MHTKVKEVLHYVVSVGVAAFAVVLYITCLDYSKERKCSITDVSEDVYAITYEAESAFPNYTCDAVMFNSGKGVQTVYGNVHINYTDNEPCIVIKDYPLRILNEVDVYVPYGAVVNK